MFSKMFIFNLGHPVVSLQHAKGYLYNKLYCLGHKTQMKEKTLNTSRSNTRNGSKARLLVLM